MSSVLKYRSPLSRYRLSRQSFFLPFFRSVLESLSHRLNLSILIIPVDGRSVSDWAANCIVRHVSHRPSTQRVRARSRTLRYLEPLEHPALLDCNDSPFANGKKGRPGTLGTRRGVKDGDDRCFPVTLRLRREKETGNIPRVELRFGTITPDYVYLKVYLGRRSV